MSQQISNPTPAVPAVFQFEDHEVRTVEKDGEVWFVARDVCNVIGLSSPSTAFGRIDDDEKAEVALTDGGQKRNTIIINESGLYSLILRSDKPEAKRFKKWVTSEVLPSIRKHGHYMTSAQAIPALPQTPMEMFLLAADAIKDLNSRTLLIESRTAQIEDVALEAVQKSEQAVTTLDDYLATRPLSHTQCYEIRFATERKKKQLAEKYSIPAGGTVYAGLYSFLKHHFKVNTYTGIPSARFEEALMIINNITLDQLSDNVKNAVPKAKKGGAK